MPPDVAQGLIEHPERERALPTVALPPDFMLWVYRDRTRLSWAALEAQPPWRTARDLAYLQLEAQARAWHDAEAADAAERNRQIAGRRT